MAFGGYKKERTKVDLIPCLSILIVISVAGVVIISSGFTDNGGGTVDKKYDLRIELYSSEYENLTGRVEIRYINDTMYETIYFGYATPGFSTKDYKGIYNLRYIGEDNGVQFGPVEFVVTGVGLVLDQTFLDVRITIHALS